MIDNSTEENTGLPEKANPKGNEHSEEEEIDAIIHKVESSIHASTTKGFDLSSLTEKQLDKIIDTADKREDHASDYFTKKLSVFEKIQSQDYNLKLIVVWAIVIIIPFMTALILFFKEDFFYSWMSFITGGGAGYGISKIPFSRLSGKDESNIDQDTNS